MANHIRFDAIRCIQILPRPQFHFCFYLPNTRVINKPSVGQHVLHTICVSYFSKRKNECSKVE